MMKIDPKMAILYPVDGYLYENSAPNRYPIRFIRL